MLGLTQPIAAEELQQSDPSQTPPPSFFLLLSCRASSDSQRQDRTAPAGRTA
ncbi:hypothetical protein COCNU_14G010930 [Cocos nucifera]|uniref:Uncharacterized protein n=1 Tax=Cocos nucifera TaxID=13894 RepID=A0A8K0IVZ4_COCNU|nr:hypothetical protein COCNU_14G010930 [Cocos nucifera]